MNHQMNSLGLGGWTTTMDHNLKDNKYVIKAEITPEHVLTLRDRAFAFHEQIMDHEELIILKTLPTEGLERLRDLVHAELVMRMPAKEESHVID